MGGPNPLSRGNQIEGLEVRVHNSRHHGGGVKVSRDLLLDAIGQVGMGLCSNGKEARQNFDHDELAPDRWPRRGKPISIVGGGVADAVGVMGKAAKDDVSGSGPIAVTFEYKESMVPIAALEVFEGVAVVVPKQQVDFGEGFNVYGLVS